MQSIDGKRMKEMIDKKKARTVDVDSQLEFKRGHIQGSINIPHNEKNFVQKVEKRFKKKTDDVVLCGREELGAQMERLGNQLEQAGFKKVHQYKGGPEEWESSGLTVRNQM